MPRSDARLRRLESLAGIAEREVTMDLAHARRLAAQSWPPAFGEMTDAHLDRWSTTLLGVYARDVSDGLGANHGVARVHAVLRAFSRMSAEDIERLAARYDATLALGLGPDGRSADESRDQPPSAVMTGAKSAASSTP